MNLSELARPFPVDDIEWRVAQAGEKNGKGWAKCLAYITSRAIMDRLDAVCGPENWAIQYVHGPGHLQAGIGIRIGEEWVWKWDGTGMLKASDGLSDADAGKGDFSNAMKRAAVQWGMGRYLYDLPEAWAIVNDNGRFYQGKSKKVTTPFRWDPPRLPDWATPNGQDPIVAEMEKLWLEGQRHGVGEDETSKAREGMNKIEIAITKGDVKTLTEARPWLQGAIREAKEAVPA